MYTFSAVNSLHLQGEQQEGREDGLCAEGTAGDSEDTVCLHNTGDKGDPNLLPSHNKTPGQKWGSSPQLTVPTADWMTAQMTRKQHKAGGLK